MPEIETLRFWNCNVNYINLGTTIKTLTKTIMKKYCFWSIVALGFAAIATMGCTESQELTSGKIVKEVNAAMEKEGSAEVFCELAVGRYECNSPSERLRLAQLEAAGLIDYEVTRYAWWEKAEVSRKKAYQVKETRGWYYTWTETVTKYKWVKETEYNFEDHYVVNVTLTRAGNKLIAEIPEIEEVVDEDLVSKDVDPETYKWNQKDLSENWPYIPNPFIEPEKNDEPAPAKTEEPVSGIEYIDDEPYHPEHPDDEDDEIERIDIKQYEAYYNETFETENLTLKAGAVKAIKARNILLKETEGILTAEAEVILETYGATDAGRILLGFENGMRAADDFELIHYLDKGWVLYED